MNFFLILLLSVLSFLNLKIFAQVPTKPIMVKVEGGTFSMGSNQCEDEKPIHKVTIESFCIGKYEITVKEYKTFCNATNRQMPSWEPIGGWIDTHPMANLTFDDAVVFCKWLSDLTKVEYRLPTEAEWEYAARGGNISKGYLYSGSDNVDEVAVYGHNSGGQTHKVGSKKPNELGLYDMSGNVWEWCYDIYSATYYSESPNFNPKGPSIGNYHVLRGGAWGMNAWDCRVTSRYESGPDYRNRNRGFRIVSNNK